MTRFRKEPTEEEHRESPYERWVRRNKETNERVKEKNIVLWDEVICDREYDWIYQRKGKYTWEFTKDFEHDNVWYEVEFERNWMKRRYPIHIDHIVKVNK